MTKGIDLLDPSAKDLIVLLEKVESLIQNEKGEAEWVMDDVIWDTIALENAIRQFKNERMRHYLLIAYAMRQKRDAQGRFAK